VLHIDKIEAIKANHNFKVTHLTTWNIERPEKNVRIYICIQKIILLAKDIVGLDSKENNIAEKIILGLRIEFETPF
jgi:hypothetical protein